MALLVVPLYLPEHLHHVAVAPVVRMVDAALADLQAVEYPALVDVVLAVLAVLVQVPLALAAVVALAVVTVVALAVVTVVAPVVAMVAGVALVVVPATALVMVLAVALAALVVVPAVLVVVPAIVLVVLRAVAHVVAVDVGPLLPRAVLDLRKATGTGALDIPDGKMKVGARGISFTTRIAIFR